MIRRWGPRLGLVAVLVVGGQLALTAIDFDPDPLGWALLVLAGCAAGWLVQDTLNAGEAVWSSGLPPYVDPDAHEQTAHSRVLDGHLDAAEPGPALRDRLVALALARDPALTDPDLRALRDAPPRRLTPTEIDHLLTRIEASRDR